MLNGGALPSLIILKILRILKRGSSTHPSMVHRAVFLNVVLFALLEGLCEVLHHFWSSVFF